MQKVLVTLLAVLLCSSIYSLGLNDATSPSPVMVYAVGENGLTLRSTNGGTSYSSVMAGTRTLNSVSGYSDLVWSVGIAGAYNKSTDNGITWITSVIGGGVNLNCVQFIDSLTGFISGANGLILKCSDGGNNWISLSSGTINNLTKVKFINSSTGYLLGENNFFAKTTNGGVNWITVPLPIAGNPASIDMYNNTIVLGMESSAIIISSNNGSNWNSVPLNIYSKPSVKSVHLISETSFLLFLESGAIWSSTNSGANFSYLIHPMFSSISACGFNGPRGYVVSSTHNAVLRTGNNGSAWSFPNNTTSGISFVEVLSGSMNSANRILDMNYQKRGTLYAMQKNMLMKSSNYGDNWSLLSTVPSNSKTCMNLLVSMKDSSKMIVVMNTDSLGFNDTCRIFRTTDYGLSWQQTFRGINDRIGNMITQVPLHPDTLFAGVRDSLYRSTDFGLSWLNIASYAFNDWCDIGVKPDNPNIMYGATNAGFNPPAKLLKSTNAGLNWFMVDFVTDTNYSEMPCLALSNLNTGMLFHAQYSNNQVLTGLKRSFTQGNSWLFTMFAGVSWSVDIAKDDPNLVAYGTVSYNPVYISTNTGSNFIATPNNWAEQILYYDRSNLFSTSGSEIYKMKVSYNMPVIGIENISSTVPKSFSLEQNYPNPFNPSTNIVFNLPERSDVKMTVYDIAGRVVSVLVNESLSGGSYKVSWDAAGNSSGIYFCKIETKGFSQTNKMILIK